jgi:hypothetical protein
LVKFGGGFGFGKLPMIKQLQLQKKEENNAREGDGGMVAGRKTFSLLHLNRTGRKKGLYTSNK